MSPAPRVRAPLLHLCQGLVGEATCQQAYSLTTPRFECMMLGSHSLDAVQYCRLDVISCVEASEEKSARPRGTYPSAPPVLAPGWRSYLPASIRSDHTQNFVVHDAQPSQSGYCMVLDAAMSGFW